jgi:hypothetical protein
MYAIKYALLVLKNRELKTFKIITSILDFFKLITSFTYNIFKKLYFYQITRVFYLSQLIMTSFINSKVNN